jgi:hypothetical protein
MHLTPDYVPGTTCLLPSMPNPFGQAKVIQFEPAHAGR